MDETMYQLLKLVTEIIILILSAYIIPTLKRLIQDYQIDKYCEKAVQTAYQVLSKDPKDNGAKKDLAVSIVRDLANKAHITITDAQISDFVESAYCAFKESKGGEA